MPKSLCPVTGKVCHTKADAKREARTARWRTLGGTISAYRCDHWARHPAGAGHFHIGHRPQPGKRSGKKAYRVRPIG